MPALASNSSSFFKIRQLPDIKYLAPDSSGAKSVPKPVIALLVDVGLFGAGQMALLERMQDTLANSKLSSIVVGNFVDAKRNELD